jgi:hypothetical protein
MKGRIFPHERGEQKGKARKEIGGERNVIARREQLL